MAKKAETMFGLGKGQIGAVTEVKSYRVECAGEDCPETISCGPLNATELQGQLSAGGWGYDAGKKRWCCPNCARLAAADQLTIDNGQLTTAAAVAAPQAIETEVAVAAPQAIETEAAAAPQAIETEVVAAPQAIETEAELQAREEAEFMAREAREEAEFAAALAEEEAAPQAIETDAEAPVYSASTRKK